MKIKSYTLAIAMLAIGASMSAMSAWGETPYYGNQSNSRVAESASPEELAGLAAELARTAAKLAEARKAQNLQSMNRTSQAVFDAEAARQFGRTRQPKQSNTVRWLGTEFDDATVYEPARTASNQFEMPAVMSVHSQPAMDDDAVTFASDQTSPRTRNRSSQSNILRTQAYAEPYQDFRQVQHAIPEPADSTAPPAIAADDAGSDNAVWNGGGYAGDACCDSCCDTCCDPCCGIARCPRRRTLVVSTEAVFLGLDINGARTSYFFEDFFNDNSIGFGQAFGHAALDDFYIAPRIGLGVQGECWGIVGRYFHLRAGENDHNPAIPANRLATVPVYDEGFDANSIFEAYYADIEVTRNFCLHGCKNQFSFGARYADIEHHESVYGVAEIEQGLFHGGARANRRSSGTGLTFGLNGRKPLFCNSCAHWFYNVRSSILWGCTTHEAETWSEALSLDPTFDAQALARNGAADAVDNDLFIGEVQVGIEWDFALRCLPAKSFFRIAFEYQYWDAALGGSGAGSFSGIGITDTTTNTILDPLALSTTFADAPGLQVDMYGMHVGTGFTW